MIVMPLLRREVYEELLAVHLNPAHNKLKLLERFAQDAVQLCIFSCILPAPCIGQRPNALIQLVLEALALPMAQHDLCKFASRAAGLQLAAQPFERAPHPLAQGIEL